MDMRLSADPYESFRIFQGRILEQYLAMSDEFNFVVMDANATVEKQQGIVRELVSQRIDLAKFAHAACRRCHRPCLTHAAEENARNA